MYSQNSQCVLRKLSEKLEITSKRIGKLAFCFKDLYFSCQMCCLSNLRQTSVRSFMENYLSIIRLDKLFV